MTQHSKLRDRIDAGTYVDQQEMFAHLSKTAALDEADRTAISAKAAQLVRDIRGHSNPGLMEVFLAEYGLSTDEGVALMCLAEALLRVPDADTIDALIEDKIAPSDWGKHLGRSSSSLVNASTWALMLTGRVLDEDRSPVGALRGAIKRLGEPVIRTAVSRAMKEMGRQFVLGENIESAMKRAAGMEAKGYTYSYDMLGEAARTEADAARYHLAYSKAISAIAAGCTDTDIRKNPGISIKLSALHPRYELAQETRVMEELVPRIKALALLAKSAKMGLNIDAEEADRLSLSLEVIEEVVSDPSLAGWDGFGVVVQAYGPRTGLALDAIYEMAEKYDRRFMVRLVKGAYWDTEIKLAQVEGVDGFPVFTNKALTDVSYIANARKLLQMTDRIYPSLPPTTPILSAPSCIWPRMLRPMSSSACMAWAKPCTTWCWTKTRPVVGSMHLLAPIVICWPIWCAGCWKTAPTALLSTRSLTKRWPPKWSPPIPLSRPRTVPIKSQPDQSFMRRNGPIPKALT